MVADSERLPTERLLAERAMRELAELRHMPKSQALYWLRALLSDITRADRNAMLNRNRIAHLREEAVQAIGLVGIELDGRYRRRAETDMLWETAIKRVQAWREATHG